MDPQFDISDGPAGIEVTLDNQTLSVVTDDDGVWVVVTDGTTGENASILLPRHIGEPGNGCLYPAYDVVFAIKNHPALGGNITTLL